MKYALHDQVLFALLVLPEDQLRALVARFDAIAAAPLQHAQAAFQDAEGRDCYACMVGRLRIYYHVAKNGLVTFVDLRHGSRRVS